ncbi:MAG: spore coat protein CotJB [Clostridia bacterium]|nr:spore coat protein CotJB [Clostridia bacterium]
MNRCKLLREISEVQFAAWELHLYLDTHPSDLRAAALMNEYERKYDMLVRKYEEQFGPLTAGSGDSAEWLASPWPWEVVRCD